MQQSLLINSQGLLQESLVSPANLIINGDFQIAQRGTSLSSSGTTLDKWFHSTSLAAGTVTVSQSSDSPSVSQSGVFNLYSLLAKANSAQSAPATGTVLALNQSIEGSLFQLVAQRPFTLSFWVKATKPGIYNVAFRNKANDRSYVAEYVINSANTWEKKSVTVLASPTSGTWDYTTGVGLSVVWNVNSGATYKTSTLNSWIIGNFFASANSINPFDVSGNEFRLALVKLEPGIISTPFHQRLPHIESNLCYRYYHRIYLNALSYTPVAVSNHSCPVFLPVPMRSVPTTVLISAPARLNVDTSSAPPYIIMGNTKDGRFQIQSVAVGNFWALNELWEFNAEI